MRYQGRDGSAFLLVVLVSGISAWLLLAMTRRVTMLHELIMIRYRRHARTSCIRALGCARVLSNELCHLAQVPEGTRAHVEEGCVVLAHEGVVLARESSVEGGL